jgi:Carboxypeptidase regulatory-like domain
MTNRTPTAILIVVLAAGLAGCDGVVAPPPTAPTAPTRPTATLSGLVFTVTPTGLSPIEGARVRLEIGSYRQDALTDQSGRYRLTDLYDGSSSVTTTRDGYDTDTRMVPISGDVLLDVRVELRVEHTLSGVVFEMTPSGRVPLEGAAVEWIHDIYETTSDGFFTFSGVFNGANALSASKEGYQKVFLTPMVKGDSRFDIQLVRR